MNTHESDNKTETINDTTRSTEVAKIKIATPPDENKELKQEWIVVLSKNKVLNKHKSKMQKTTS